jgi:PKD repeat protein
VSVNASLSKAAVGHTIVSWEWDFGDGSALVSSGGPQANHTYSTAGSFTIVLRITDNFGLTHAVAKSVTITP